MIHAPTTDRGITFTQFFFFKYSKFGIFSCTDKIGSLEKKIEM